MRLIASNTTIPRFCTSGFEALNTVWPHCPETGASQVLNPSEISQPAGGCGQVFYDEEFTVVFALSFRHRSAGTLCEIGVQGFAG